MEEISFDEHNHMLDHNPNILVWFSAITHLRFCRKYDLKFDLGSGQNDMSSAFYKIFCCFWSNLGWCLFSHRNKRKLSSVGSAWPSRITASIKSFTFPSISIQRRSKFPKSGNERSYQSDCNTKVSALVCRAISYNEQSALIDCYYPLVSSHPTFSHPNTQQLLV